MLGSYPGSTLKCTFSNILGEYDYTMLAQMQYFTREEEEKYIHV